MSTRPSYQPTECPEPSAPENKVNADGRKIYINSYTGITPIKVLKISKLTSAFQITTYAGDVRVRVRFIAFICIRICYLRNALAYINHLFRMLFRVGSPLTN